MHDFELAIGAITAALGFAIGVKIERPGGDARLPGWLGLGGFLVGVGAAALIVKLVLFGLASATIVFLGWSFGPAIKVAAEHAVRNYLQQRAAANRPSFAEELSEVAAQHDEKIVSINDSNLSRDVIDQLVELAEGKFHDKLKKLTSKDY